DLLIGSCPKGGAERLAGFLTALPLRVTGVRPFQQAQVTCGGVDTREVDPMTLESRLCPGLYPVGELLNADGDCGGYNLQFAFATGLIAGRNAAI
ncbi:MAG: NAD(P)/FAD-dependent oxidoreductase, partial [Clostridia bacterium]|nr:NAD(P)/FAD-dependent oxidoreductase [Clostridia bacterium]